MLALIFIGIYGNIPELRRRLGAQGGLYPWPVIMGMSVEVRTQHIGLFITTISAVVSTLERGCSLRRSAVSA